MSERQLIQIPDNYAWSEEEALAKLDALLQKAKTSGLRLPYTPGANSITDTAKSPAELAAVYPMNARNEAVARQAANSFRLPGGGGGTLADVLNMADELNRSGIKGDAAEGLLGNRAGGQVARDIVGDKRAALMNAESNRMRVNDELGVGGQPNEKRVLYNDLARKAGTPDFESAITEAIANGGIRNTKDQTALENLHNVRVKQRTVSDKQLEGITSAENSYRALSELKDAYENTSAAKSGKVSDTMKLALATAGKLGAGALELNAIPGWDSLSPDDRAYVAKFNRTGLQLRGLANDSRFSNFDAQKAIDAIGNPLVGPELYREQLGSVISDVGLKHDNALDNMGNSQGKNVKAFKRLSDSKAVSGNTRITVVSPTGKVGSIPANQWEEAQKSGYRRQ